MYTVMKSKNESWLKGLKCNPFLKTVNKCDIPFGTFTDLLQLRLFFKNLKALYEVLKIRETKIEVFLT